VVTDAARVFGKVGITPSSHQSIDRLIVRTFALSIFTLMRLTWLVFVVAGRIG
jgi:hypothetical protein